MRREGRLVLSAKQGSGMAGQTAENHIVGIDDVPLTRNIVRGWGEGTHGELAFLRLFYLILLLLVPLRKVRRQKGKVTCPLAEGQNQ